MKVKIGNTSYYLDIGNSHPYQLSQHLDEETRNKFQYEIDDRDLKCGGCEKALKGRGWVSTFHRSKSSYNEEEQYPKEVWAIFFLCSDTIKECGNKWLEKRPK